MKAIIPCAGRSDRFNNQCKALVSLNGQTVIERIVKQISPHVDSVTIIKKEHKKILLNQNLMAFWETREKFRRDNFKFSAKTKRA